MKAILIVDIDDDSVGACNINGRGVDDIGKKAERVVYDLAAVNWRDHSVSWSIYYHKHSCHLNKVAYSRKHGFSGKLTVDKERIKNAHLEATMR